MYKFGEISGEQLSLTLFTLMGSFCPNHIKFQLKSTEELSLKTLKVIQSLKKLTCCFKYHMRNLVNFHPTTQKSAKFNFDRPFCTRHIRLEPKNTGELSFITLNSDAKSE